MPRVHAGRSHPERNRGPTAYLPTLSRSILIRNFNRACEKEQAALAKPTTAQMLIKSHMAAKGPRPISQDLSVRRCFNANQPDRSGAPSGREQGSIRLSEFRRVVCRRAEGSRRVPGGGWARSAAILSASASVSRDFPNPGSAESKTTRPRPAFARSQRRSSSTSSSSRATGGERLRARNAAKRPSGAPGPLTSQASIGSTKPSAATGPSARSANSAPTNPRVPAAINTVSTAASDSRAPVRLGASPSAASPGAPSSASSRADRTPAAPPGRSAR